MKHHAWELHRYHAWANQKVIDRLKELPRNICDMEIQSVFPTVSRVLAHIYITDCLWFAVVSGEENDEIFPKIARWTEESNDVGLEETEKLYAAIGERYESFLSGHPNLDAAMTIRHPKYGALDTRPSEIIQHVVNHGTYHRGNITAMLRQLGHAGVPTDYAFYLFEIRNGG